jgi:hypothetical protein
MKCKPRKYSDGGKVVDREYGTPTFPSALKNRLGMDDDGYGNSMKKPQPKKMDVSNVASEFKNVMAARKKALDDT